MMACRLADKLKLYPHKVEWINGFPQHEKAEFKSIKLDQYEPLKNWNVRHLLIL